MMDIIYRIDVAKQRPPVRPATPKEAFAVLAAGNARYAGLAEQVRKLHQGKDADKRVVIDSDPVSFGLPVVSSDPIPQTPFAAVLGCSDARVPVEVVFDVGSNHVFVARNAGNVLGTEALGSIDYAARHMEKSLMAAVVLGHRFCGAVGAAVKTYLHPKEFGEIAFSPALRTQIDRLILPVRGAAQALDAVCGKDVQTHPKYPDALAELTTYLSAAITAFDLARSSPELLDGVPQVGYTVFDITTQKIHATPDPKTAPPFAFPPAKPDEMTALGAALANAIVSAGFLP